MDGIGRFCRKLQAQIDKWRMEAWRLTVQNLVKDQLLESLRRQNQRALERAQSIVQTWHRLRSSLSAQIRKIENKVSAVWLSSLVLHNKSKEVARTSEEVRIFSKEALEELLNAKNSREKACLSALNQKSLNNTLKLELAGLKTARAGAAKEIQKSLVKVDETGQRLHCLIEAVQERLRRSVCKCKEKKQQRSSVGELEQDLSELDFKVQQILKLRKRG